MIGQKNPPAPRTGYHVSSETATTLTTIVAPAANTKGIRIDKASVLFISATDGRSRIMAKTSAPADANDATALTIATCKGQASNVSASHAPLVGSITLPAGFGLYHQQTANYSSDV